ncbi:DUF551 domain-containing protein [Enterobacter cloacae complex sp. RIVM_C039474]|uniref:DUF551 domain-containing protein n=1 Tax=Enterobacter cloacae complex sp. RIVM_C039474 TaxID=2900327 RepID=UPI002340C2D2|nr:DUF551 domain-containing protein [Enterobacter cloacae complex sp. RIVM_C039474]MDC4196931.1 DUF551 domain-containing protein [Enterobacter cloacae complex sp. RIVM_C039474]
MSTITKEQAQKIIEAADEVITALAGTNEDVHPEDSRKMCDLWDDLNDRYAPPEVVRELARIALASLEAEPVAYSLIFRNMDGVLNDYVNANTTFSTIEKAQAYGRGGNYVRQNDGSLQWVSDPSLDPVVVPLYTSPPAPVSVPVEVSWEDVPDEITEDDMEVALAWAHGFNQCRAAMLQGAEPVTTDYKLPDDFDFDRFNDVVWLETVASNPHMHSLTTSTIAMVALELNKRLEAGNSPVIPDGWVACSERMPEKFKAILAFNEYGEVWSGAYDRYWNFYCDNLLVEHVTHWMPLPVAPQQEVN